MSTSAAKIYNARHGDARVISTGLAKRVNAGKVLRKKVPRSSHGERAIAVGRPDPIAVLQGSDRGRLPELLPIRYGRMRRSPFAFFRGSAAVMAWDLSRTPTTGIRVQVCGDCHAANFGGFASPERRLLFDINDFDETVQAPWEWDVKRLAASIVLASRELGLDRGRCEDAVLTTVQSYRERMPEYSQMRALQVWYSHMDAEVFIKEARTAASRKRWEQVEEEAREGTAEHIFPRIAKITGGHACIVDHPPLIYHPRESDVVQRHVTRMLALSKWVRGQLTCSVRGAELTVFSSETYEGRDSVRSKSIIIN